MRFAVPGEAVCRGIRRIAVRAIDSFYRRRAALPGRVRTGCVVFTQRFDSALRLNVHFHALWPDGVFAFRPSSAEAEFWPVMVTDADVDRLARALRHRVDRWLRKRGYLEDEPAHDPDPGAALAAAAVQGRIPFGRAAGALDPRLRDDPPARGGRRSELCASAGGYSLHAAVRVPCGARARLEKLCRYAARPPIVPERLQLSRDGRKVIYALKRRWRDGSTHVVLDPLTLLARLAALIPRPRVHLTTYYGVLAPAASGRSSVVPAAPDDADEPARCRGARGGRAAGVARRRRRYSWAELMKRVFAIDVLRCPRCGGRRIVTAFVMEAEAVCRVLRHLGLAAESPAIAPARPPPGEALLWES